MQPVQFNVQWRTRTINCSHFLKINLEIDPRKLAPHGTAVDYWERRRHLANVIAIAKAFAK